MSCPRPAAWGPSLEGFSFPASWGAGPDDAVQNNGDPRCGQEESVLSSFIHPLTLAGVNPMLPHVVKWVKLLVLSEIRNLTWTP